MARPGTPPSAELRLYTSEKALPCSCSEDGCPDIPHLWKLLGISHGIHQGQGWAAAPSPREIPSVLPQDPQLEAWLDENSDLLT